MKLMTKNCKEITFSIRIYVKDFRSFVKVWVLKCGLIIFKPIIYKLKAFWRLNWVLKKTICFAQNFFTKFNKSKFWPCELIHEWFILVNFTQYIGINSVIDSLQKYFCKSRYELIQVESLSKGRWWLDS